MTAISVKMLGCFEITAGGVRFDLSLSKSKKGWMLAKYLFFHRDRSTSNSELIEVLWSGDDDGAHDNALKTSISRMRSFFSDIDPSLNRLILTGDSSYFVNPEIHVDVDALTFQALGARLSGEEALTDDSRELFDKFFELYTGVFLPADGRDGDNWVIAKREAFSNLYLSTLYHYLGLLTEAGDDEALLTVCRDALEIVAYDEQLQQVMMEALSRTRRGTEARLQSLREREGKAGAPIAEGMRSYYQKISQLNRMIDTDIDKIRDDLTESSNRRGAFFCEYNFFKEIQYIQKRHLERLNTSLFIALIAVNAKDGGQIKPDMLNESMELLKEILNVSLRMGDTVAQHGAGQYVMLLPTVNEKTGVMIMKRITAAFEKIKVHPEIECVYTVSPLLA